MDYEAVGRSPPLVQSNEGFWLSESLMEPIAARIDRLVSSLQEDSLALASIEAAVPNAKAYFRQQMTTKQ